MIYAKTGMERMPERCGERRHSFTNPGTRYCHNTSRTTPEDGRPTWCPLTSIDETLPAQLAAAKADVAAAEARIKKLDRLMEFEEGTPV